MDEYVATFSVLGVVALLYQCRWSSATTSTTLILHSSKCVFYDISTLVMVLFNRMLNITDKVLEPRWIYILPYIW